MSTDAIVTLSVILSFFIIATIISITFQILFEKGKLKKKPLSEKFDNSDVYDFVEQEINSKYSEDFSFKAK